MQITTALNAVRREAAATRIIHRELCMAPGIEQADISRQVARGVPAGQTRLIEGRRPNHVSVLKAGDPTAVPHLLRAQRCLLDTGQRAIVRTEIRNCLSRSEEHTSELQSPSYL